MKIEANTAHGSVQNFYEIKFKPAEALEYRQEIFNQLKFQLPRRLSLKDPEDKEHWYTWIKKDVVISDILHKYRELEQVRFVYLYQDRFHPMLLDKFIEVINKIFDLRTPPLLMILGKYNEFSPSNPLDKPKQTPQ